MRRNLIVCALFSACVGLTSLACVAQRAPVPRAAEPGERTAKRRITSESPGSTTESRGKRSVPSPTEHWLDEDAERRNREERKAWIEHMHRAAPDVDWRTIERENARLDQERRNLLAAIPAAGTTHWTEVGSSNLAGRMHTAVLAPDGEKLYGGSSLGGVWRANLDGTAWEPLGDNLWGGAHELLVLPGESPGEPDVIVAITDSGLVHVSRDEGLSWEAPSGIGDLWNVRGAAVLNDPARTILLHGRGPSTGYFPTIFASTDYGRTFASRWQGSELRDGWMWVPRTGPGSAASVYLADAGEVRISSDGGFTFRSTTVVAGADRGVLAGSEAGAPRLYAAFRLGNQWKLYRSDDAGDSWVFTYDIPDFWESLTASILDPDVVFFGGVECYRSTDGGSSFVKFNGWGDYYADPANKLHADIPGLHCWLQPSAPGHETCYVSTDGGLYRMTNGWSGVENLSLFGLAVSQYYSTHSSRLNWNSVSVGSQDQGYQTGLVQHTDESGPSTPLTQVISGDYGHLTSNDGSNHLVFSTYPGFILVQDGPAVPVLHFVDFPAGSQHAWLPPVVGDPTVAGSFYFAGEYLYRYDRVSTSSWVVSYHTHKRFGGTGVDGNYISALAFAPSDPDRVYAVNDHGHLYYSTDHGITWTDATGSAPAQQYFYGNAIAVHPTDPLEVAVGGSGYSTPGVIRSIDGGQTWFSETVGLPSTLVYALVYAEDGSGDLYAGTETGAWRWDRQTGLWESIMANQAPATIYWSVESVNDGGTIRYGTYGRGIWDYSIVLGDRDGDGVPDDQDVCGNNVDPDQPDVDLDGVGDACDNCGSVVNADQANADGDVAGDACDCSPSDPDVFAVPPEVGGVGWSAPDVLSWNSSIPLAGHGTLHSVHRGGLGEFPVGSSSDCETTVLAENSLTDPETPVPGSGYWYLVHGTNSCGTGSLGTWGEGVERDVPACTP